MTAVSGDALRMALLDGMKRKNLTVGQLARRAGLRSSSSLHNFFSYHTQSLNLQTVQRVALVLEFDLAVLTGLPPVAAGAEFDKLVAQATELGAPAKLQEVLARLRRVVAAQAVGAPTLTAEHIAAELVQVRVHVDEEGQRESLTLPPEFREPLTGRMSSRDAGRRAFGVRVIGRAGQPVYDSGTVLICVPPDGQIKTLRAGRRVLVCCRPHQNKARWKMFEVEIREVRQGKDGLALYPLGINPRSRVVQVPPGIQERVWTDNDVDMKISGIVISAVIPEEPPT